MPRRRRNAAAGFVYHVLNRAVRRADLFKTPADYYAFERVMLQALQRVPIRMLAYCAMPNHWHLVVWPQNADDLPRFMHWLTCTHAQRWHAWHTTVGTGPVYQGRYKAIPVKCDEHLLTVCRYVERNPLRAGLVSRAQDWRWSSTWRRWKGRKRGLLDEWPVPRPANWIDWVNQPQTRVEVESMRDAIRRGAPFGDSAWQGEAVHLLGLETTLRPVGRPKKGLPESPAK